MNKPTIIWIVRAAGCLLISYYGFYQHWGLFPGVGSFLLFFPF